MKRQSKKNEFDEQLVQRFPHRCPYCDQPISYDQFDLKVGENEVECFSCKKMFIKVIVPSFTESGFKSKRRSIPPRCYRNR